MRLIKILFTLYRPVIKLMYCMLFCKTLTKGEHEGVLLMALESYKYIKVLLWTENILSQIYISLSLIVLVILMYRYNVLSNFNLSLYAMWHK